MKTASIATIVLTAVAVATAWAQSSTVQEQFLGVYTLGEYAPHGDEPTGRISYDAAGRMWAMLTPPGREPIEGSASAEQYRDSMRGLVAYYGSYTIDEPTGRVIHHVEAASNPAWIGDDFVRWYRFEGTTLTLSLNPDFDGTLVWERLTADE